MYAYFYGGAKFVPSAQWRLFVLTCRFELIPFRRKLCWVFFFNESSVYHKVHWAAHKDSQLVLGVSQLKSVLTFPSYPLSLERNLICLFKWRWRLLSVPVLISCTLSRFEVEHEAFDCKDWYLCNLSHLIVWAPGSCSGTVFWHIPFVTLEIKIQLLLRSTIVSCVEVAFAWWEHGDSIRSLLSLHWLSFRLILTIVSFRFYQHKAIPHWVYVSVFWNKKHHSAD
jgi:hypothetical protein